MTPAAALSQAAMDVTPAYAATGDEDTPIALKDGTTSFTGKGPGAAGPNEPAPGWSEVTVVEGAFVPAVYDNGSHVPAKPTIKVKYTYYTESPHVKHEEWYQLDAAQITPAYKKGGAPATDTIAAGSYTATYTVTTTDTGSTADSIKAAVDCIKDSNAVKNLVQSFEIQKAVATVTLPEGVVGVDSPNDLATDPSTKAENTTTALSATPTITYYNTNRSGASLTGGDTANTAKYATEGRAKVTIKATNADANNYKFMVGDNELTDFVSDSTHTTFTTDVAIKNAGTYEVAITDVTTPGQAITGVDNDKALEAQYRGSDLDGALKGAIAVKANGTTVANDFVYLDADGRAMVDSQGNPEHPTMPGKYQVQVKVGDKVVQTLPLTVYVDLNTMVNLKADAPANTKLMSLTIDGRPADDAKLAFKDNIAFADVKSQIEDSAVATLNVSGEDPASVDFAKTFEVTKGTLAQTAGAAGTAYIEPISEDGVYRGKLEVKYTYGTLLPEASLVKASYPYSGPASGSGNGYAVESLVAVDKPVGGSALVAGTDYTVTATRIVDGEPEVTTGANKITEVGTYTVVVEGAGSYVGKSQEMTFAITPLTLKFGANGNATVTYSDLDPTAGGGFSATYTGGQIKPATTVTVNFAGGPVTLKVPDPANKNAAYDYTVSYGDNTTVAEGGTVDLAFTGNYAYDGAYSQAFAITPASLSDLGAKATAASQLKSEFDNTVEGVQVKLPGVDGKVLEEGVDYTVSAPTKASSQAGVPAGCTKYEFTVTGKGNYSDSATGVIGNSFLVTDKSIEGVYDVVVEEGSVYDPYESATPEYKVYLKGSTTDEAPASNYSVSWENNENATTEAAPAYAVITGTGQYAGQIKVPFQIAPLELSDASNVKGSVKLSGAEGLVYNGKEQVPTVSIKDSAVTPVNKGYDGGEIDLKDIADDVTFGHEGGVNAGTSYVTIVPKNGNFTGQVKVPYEIAPAELKADNVAVAASTAPGADAAVSVTFGETVLAAGTDYTVKTEGTLPGKVKATVTGTGNFTGTVEKEATVLYDVAKADVAVADAVYNGKAQDPKVEVSYTDGGKKVVVPADAYAVSVAGGASNAGSYK
ncbi:hypothetical protein GMI69_05685, partial [Eggerthellaceae bacterium zg-887]|uniref:hypothetical protein n=1 Tax=Xiamenia xianingshaonis TaxID=2682776 RepID=UPI00140C61DC